MYNANNPSIRIPQDILLYSFCMLLVHYLVQLDDNASHLLARFGTCVS